MLLEIQRAPPAGFAFTRGLREHHDLPPARRRTELCTWQIAQFLFLSPSSHLCYGFVARLVGMRAGRGLFCSSPRSGSALTPTWSTQLAARTRRQRQLPAPSANPDEETWHTPAGPRLLIRANDRGAMGYSITRAPTDPLAPPQGLVGCEVSTDRGTGTGQKHRGKDAAKHLQTWGSSSVCISQVPVPPPRPRDQKKSSWKGPTRIRDFHGALRPKAAQIFAPG